jgi:hypothetical protein
VTRSLVVCAVAGCPEPARPGRRGRCDAHSLTRRRARRERELALDRTGGRCVDCGGEATDADHVVAVVDGGGDTADELEPRCAPCHRARHRLPHRRRPGVT